MPPETDRTIDQLQQIASSISDARVVTSVLPPLTGWSEDPKEKLVEALRAAAEAWGKYCDLLESA